MNLHALRVFTVVAEQKSVTEAANILAISQPAATIQIRNLEREIGFKLLEAKGRGIRLTSVGEFLYKQSMPMFFMEKNIENRLKDLKEGTCEKVRIASTYLPANFLLPACLASFKKEYPAAEVDLYSGNSAETINRLMQYKADIAFLVKEEWAPCALEKIHLFDMEFCFILPQGHPYAGKEISLEQLVKEPFLLREEGSSTREMLLALCKVHGVQDPVVGLQFHGLNESIQSVVAGYGIMLAPFRAVAGHIARKEVGWVKVKGIEIKRPVYLCCRTQDEISAALIQKMLPIVKKHSGIADNGST
jgi:DNA-binding transcriptional LysR family regulator